MGGFGSAVLEALSDKGIRTPVERMGWPDHFIEHGKPEQLRLKYGLTVDAALEKLRPHLAPQRPLPARLKNCLSADRDAQFSWRGISCSSNSLIQENWREFYKCVWEGLIELNARKKLKQSGDFQSSHSGQATGQALHLVRQFFIDAPARFIHGRTD